MRILCIQDTWGTHCYCLMFVFVLKIYMFTLQKLKQHLASYVLISICALLCCVFCACPDAHAKDDIPKLWMASGIPQRLQGDLQWVEKYWIEKYGDDLTTLRLPHVVASEHECWNSVPNPTYHGVVDILNGYLQLTRCIPEETFNSTDRITTAAFPVLNSKPVYISTNIGSPYICDTDISIITASKRPGELLPPGFSVSSFTESGTAPDTGELIFFYLALELPHSGTDVLAHIRPLPVGLLVSRNSPDIEGDRRLTSPWPWRPDQKEGNPLDVPYAVNTDKTLLFSVLFAPHSGHSHRRIFDTDLSPVCGELQKSGYDTLLQRPWTTLTHEQKRMLADALPLAPWPWDDSLAHLEYLHLLETAWNSLHWETLVLGWNEEQGRFFIKSGKTRARKVNITSYCLGQDQGNYVRPFENWLVVTE